MDVVRDRRPLCQTQVTYSQSHLMNELSRDLILQFFSITQCFSVAVVPFLLTFREFKAKKKAVLSLSLGSLYSFLMFVLYTFPLIPFYNCLFCRIIWYACNVLYIITFQELLHLTGDICKGIVSLNLCRYPHSSHYFQ